MSDFFAVPIVSEIEIVSTPIEFKLCIHFSIISKFQGSPYGLPNPIDK